MLMYMSEVSISFCWLVFHFGKNISPDSSSLFRHNCPCGYNTNWVSKHALAERASNSCVWGHQPRTPYLWHQPWGEDLLDQGVQANRV